jgi:hypothetical protein
MKPRDAFWVAALAAVVALLVIPGSRTWIMDVTKFHPFVMGFVKFGILASMGELLSIRMVTGGWTLPPGPQYRVIVWGLLGAGLVAVFPVFSAGTKAAADAGLLPVWADPAGERVLAAHLVSVVMNLTWAPTLMLYHRLTDTYLDLAGGRLRNVPAVPLAGVVGAINWNVFVGFVVFRTIPLFWIPAHTITFLLPPEARVLFAAFLSLALGAILGFAKRRKAPAGAAPL